LLRGGELPFQTLIVGWTLVYLAIFGSAFALMFIAPRVSGHVVLASLIYFLALLVEPLVTAGWSTPGRFTPLFVGVLIAAGTVRQKAYGPISIFIAIGLGLAAILVEFI
jgi:peptidoglycan/LPS O-acetylase OafA/YrhL